MSFDLKSNKNRAILGVIALVLVVVLAMVFSGGGSDEAVAPESEVAATEAQEATEPTDTAATDEPAAPVAEDPGVTETETTAAVEAEPEEVLTPVALPQAELDAALAERSLGEADAPATIHEFSSLTCSHCGDFHKNVFKNLKAELIDTGKARLIMSDFPLNGPALQASMVARCLPTDKYFDYVQLLFETQDQWAYSPDFKKFLKQNAQLAGLSAQKFEDCFASEPLRNGILAMVQKAQTDHQVNSTPTFVVNGKEKVEGTKTVDDFVKAIEKAK